MTNKSQEVVKVEGKDKKAIESAVADYIYDWLTSSRRDAIFVRGWRDDKEAEFAAKSISKWVGSLSYPNAEPIECGCGNDGVGNFVQLRKAGNLQ